MEFVKVATLISIFAASIFLVIWLFRPNSKKLYNEYSEMPLKNDRKIVEKKASGKRRKKKRTTK